MLQDVSTERKPARAAASCVWLLLVLASQAACERCPPQPRPRVAALSLAQGYLADYLHQNQISTDVSALQLTAERYQGTDRAWYFRFRSSEGACDVEVAVPDCEATELSGGGCESR